MKLLVLRPRPGAEETAARAATMGFDPVVAPLFRIEPIAWEPPDPAAFEAVLFTSASAPRCAGSGLARYGRLPAYVVGERTGRAAREAGFDRVIVGSSDGNAIAAMMAKDGIRHALHLSGEEVARFEPGPVTFDRRAVYRAVPDDETVPRISEALGDGALALVHSPRAAARLRGVAIACAADRSAVTVAAISQAAACAAGDGWRMVAVADAPRDEALLELAQKLCDKAACR